MTAWWAICVVIVACIIGSFGAISLKVSSNRHGFNLVRIMRCRYFIFGILFYGISTLMFISALRYGELSVLYPLVGTSYIWISLLSVKYLNEEMNLWKWAGVCVIVLGVGFIGFGS
ncbi:MAG: EamA family transporter [archaeon]